MENLREYGARVEFSTIVHGKTHKNKLNVIVDPVTGDVGTEFTPTLLIAACVGGVVCMIVVLVGCAEFCRRHSGFKVKYLQNQCWMEKFSCIVLIWDAIPYSSQHSVRPV